MASVAAEEDKRRDAFASIRIWIPSTRSLEASTSQVYPFLPTPLDNGIYRSKIFKMRFTISTVLAILMATMTTAAALPTSRFKGTTYSSSPLDSH
jgi:hypothetical protein